jgi:hypothetical protein
MALDIFNEEFILLEATLLRLYQKWRTQLIQNYHHLSNAIQSIPEQQSEDTKGFL